MITTLLAGERLLLLHYSEYGVEQINMVIVCLRNKFEIVVFIFDRGIAKTKIRVEFWEKYNCGYKLHCKCRSADEIW